MGEFVDPRKVRSQKLILDAFNQLLQEKDFYKISINDITKKAVVNRSTFYAHFQDKYELLDKVIEDTFLSYLPEAVMNADKFDEDICRQLINLTHNYLIALHKRCKYDINPTAKLFDEKVRQILRLTICSIIERELSTQSSDIEIVAAMISASIYDATLNWIQGTKDRDIEKLISIINKYILSGYNSSF